MNWCLELPVHGHYASSERNLMIGKEELDELIKFSQSYFSVQAVNFAWLEQSQRVRVGGHSGIPQKYYDDYEVRLSRSDPLGPEGIINKKQRIYCLSGLASPRARQHIEALRQYGFSDEMDLVLYDKHDALAVLTVFSKETIDKSRLDSLDAFRRFMECYIVNHPRAREKGRKRLLTRDCGLTPRELEVVEHIRKGRSNKEISECLNITLATVKTHVVRVLSKTNTQRRSELIAFIE